MKKDEDKAPREMGVISLGVSLIIGGIILLISVFTDMEAMRLFIPAGPVILMVLIAEISWFNYKEREEHEKIVRAAREKKGQKYEKEKIGKDQILIVFLISIVLLIVFVLLFSRTEAGQNFIMEIGRDDYGFDQGSTEQIEGVKTIVIDAENIPNINIKMMDIDRIEYKENKIIRAKSKEEAEKIFKENGVKFNIAGERLYISQKTYGEELSERNEITLTIPSDKQIKMLSGRNVAMDILDIKNNIRIEDFDRINIRIDEDLDATIEALTFKNQNLKGNVMWNIDDKEYNKFLRSRGVTKIGDGTHQIDAVKVKKELKVQKR